MVTKTYVKIKGLEELAEFLDILPGKLGRNTLRGAVRAGCVPMKDYAKAAAPIKTGALRRSLRVTSRGLRNGNAIGKVRAGGRVAGGTIVRHAHLIEYGTKPHLIPNSVINGRFVGTVHHPGTAPRPFMRPAFDAQGRNGIREFAEYIRNRLSTQYGINVSGPGNYDDPEEL